MKYFLSGTFVVRAKTKNDPEKEICLDFVDSEKKGFQTVLTVKQKRAIVKTLNELEK